MKNSIPKAQKVMEMSLTPPQLDIKLYNQPASQTESEAERVQGKVNNILL